MGFYYISVISWFAFGIYFAITAAIIITICSKNKLSKYWKAGLLTVAFIAPWTEELWIAYNFGQLCRKDAGTFVYKTVEVEGFYDAIGSSGVSNIGGSVFKFVEQRDAVYNTITRIEKADDASRNLALAWFAKKNPGKERPKDASVMYLINDKEQIAVWPNGIDAWHVTKIDKPTARYHYTAPNAHTPVGHKITKIQRVVIDTQTGDTLARQTKYARHAYWFFIHLSAPVLLCPTPGERPNEERLGMLYNAVLKPITAK